MKLIGLAYSWKANKKKLCVTVPFLLCFILYLRAISNCKPPGAYILERQFKGGFSCITSVGGLIFGGAYTWRGLFSEFYSILTKSI